MRNQTIESSAIFNHFSLEEVQIALQQLEDEFSQYLEQESIRSDVQCLRNWIDGYLQGDNEAVEYLQQHGVQLLDNVKLKLQTAAREIQRVDEESPNGGNFSGGKADRLTKAAQTALDAETKLCEALEQEPNCAESPIVTK